MATKKVGGIAITLSANTKPWSRSFRNAKKDLGTFQMSLGKTTKRLLAFGASYLAIRRVATSIRGAMREIDNLAKTSDKLGIATERLAGIQYAAGRTGVGIEQLHKGMLTMVQGVGDAARGIGEAKDALEALGVSAEALNRLTPDKQFMAIADAMGNVTDSTQKLNIAMDIFGKRGSSLINTLALGRTGLQQMQDRANKLGITMSRDLARGVEEANDSLTDLGLFFDGVIKQATAQLSPVIKQLSEDFISWATEGEPMAIKISYAMETVAVSTLEVAYAIKEATEAITGLIMSTKDFITLKSDKKAQDAAAGYKMVKDMLFGPEVDMRSWADVQRDKTKALAEEATTLEGRIRTTRSMFARMREGMTDDLSQVDDKVVAFGQSQVDFFAGIAEQVNALGDPTTYENIRTEMDKTIEHAKTLQAAKDEAAKASAQTAREELHKEQQMRQSNFDFIAGGLRDIVSNSNMSAKEQFKVNKALNIAEATMNTATAITGYLGQQNYPMAITAGIIGAAQVAAISSTTFDGGGTIAAVSGAEATAQTQAEPSRMVNINLGDNRGRFSREEIMSIMDGVSEAVGDGVQFNFA